MGVKGLKTFIEQNDGLFLKRYHLHDCTVVIDAPNLLFILYTRSQNHERRDLFGGDMVQFGRFLNKFFDALQRCNIDPVLVFDGAQTNDENSSKTEEKRRRAIRRFRDVMKITSTGFGEFILPATASNVFKSIAVDRKLTIIQCMFEADLEIARVANYYRAPVLSNDSDFFLMNLDHGLVLIDHLEYNRPRSNSYFDRRSGAPKIYYYMQCSLFKFEFFGKYLPHLDTDNLPLLGILAGNDFIDKAKFEGICSQMSKSRYGSQRQFRMNRSDQHARISRILHFLCGKSLNEAVNQVCARMSREHRPRIKRLIKSHLTVYNVPVRDTFQDEMIKLARPDITNDNWNSTHYNQIAADCQPSTEWIKNCTEHSVSNHTCLELLNRNTVFLSSHLDDPNLPSAHICKFRPMRVMLTLTRFSRAYIDSCALFDRIDDQYKELTLEGLGFLENFGELDYTLLDVPRLDQLTRREILLATFYCTPDEFDTHIDYVYEFLEPSHAEEFLMLKFLMDYIDFENQQVHLWKRFRQAVLLCVLYHYCAKKSDRVLMDRVGDSYGIDRDFQEVMAHLKSLIARNHMHQMPVLSRRRLYNLRLMHQITQLQSTMVSYNLLNSLLGEVMVRVRTENWLNSCVIYNLAEGLHNRTIELPRLPDIVFNIPRATHRRGRSRSNTRRLH